MGKTKMSESLVSIGNSLKTNEKRITAKLGGMIKWEYFCSAFLTMVEKNPLLAECTEASLVRSVLDAAQLRLIPDGVLGEAYIVPYGKTATLIVGYKGLIQLCLRSEAVKKIGARIVYENDYFKYEYGMNEACRHIPTEDEPGEIRGAYGTFEMSDGVKGFEFWPYKRLEIHAIRYVPGIDRKDKKGNFTSLWHTNREAWMLKTVIRSITKLLPKSIEEIVHANAIEDGVTLDMAEQGAIDIEVNKENYLKSKEALDAEKPNLDALKDEEKPGPGIADENAEPPDDLDDIPLPELIDEKEVSAFLAKARKLSIPSVEIIAFVKKNGFIECTKITKEKYQLMMDGLDHLSK